MLVLGKRAVFVTDIFDDLQFGIVVQSFNAVDKRVSEDSVMQKGLLHDVLNHSHNSADELSVCDACKDLGCRF